MEATARTDVERLRELATKLDCILDEDLQLLADAKPSTTEAWRKRGQGPAFVRIGNRPLYPRQSVVAFIEGRKREPLPLRKALL